MKAWAPWWLHVFGIYVQRNSSHWTICPTWWQPCAYVRARVTVTCEIIKQVWPQRSRGWHVTRAALHVRVTSKGFSPGETAHKLVRFALPQGADHVFTPAVVTTPKTSPTGTRSRHTGNPSVNPVISVLGIRDMADYRCSSTAQVCMNQLDLNPIKVISDLGWPPDQLLDVYKRVKQENISR